MVALAWRSRVGASAFGMEECPPQAATNPPASPTAKTMMVRRTPLNLLTDRGPLRRQVLDAVDKCREQAVRLAGGVDVRQDAEQFSKGQGDLSARQVGTEAEMGT